MNIPYTFFKNSQPSVFKQLYKMTLCLPLVFIATSLLAQVSTGFEHITAISDINSANCRFIDADISPHQLQNYTPVCGGIITVLDLGTTSILGYECFFIQNGNAEGGAAPGDIGFTEGDNLGVGSSAGIEGQLGTGLGPPEGSNAFLMEDPDGEMSVEFIKVDLTAAISPMFNMQYALASTTWENADDLRIIIEITDCGAATTVTLLDIDGVDIGGADTSEMDNLEGVWRTLSTNLTAYIGCMAQLKVIFSSSSSAEEMAIDNINFTAGVGVSLALPVELVSFEAKEKNNEIHLSWKTGSEANNDYFQIERSQDGRIFEAIGEIKGIGDSEDVQQYEFMDRNPQNGLNYYRLRQVDYDGSEEVHKVVSVMLGKGNGSISIYPNPASNSVQLKLDEAVQTETIIKLLDINGRLVSQSTIEPNSIRAEMDVSTLVKGIYVLQLQRGQDIESHRFVKN